MSLFNIHQQELIQLCETYLDRFEQVRFQSYVTPPKSFNVNICLLSLIPFVYMFSIYLPTVGR